MSFNSFRNNDIDEQDSMLRAFRKVPSDNELRRMSNTELAEQQSQYEPNSQGYILIDKEWNRRNCKWYQRSLGLIWIGAVGAVIATLVIFLIKKYSGLTL